VSVTGVVKARLVQCIFT